MKLSLIHAWSLDSWLSTIHIVLHNSLHSFFGKSKSNDRWMIKQSDHNLYCSASSGKWTGLICVCGVCVCCMYVCVVLRCLCWEGGKEKRPLEIVRLLQSLSSTFIIVTENILICSTAVSLYDVLKHSIRKIGLDQLVSPAHNNAPFTR